MARDAIRETAAGRQLGCCLSLVVLLGLMPGCWVGKTVCRGLGNARTAFGCKVDQRQASGDEPAAVVAGQVTSAQGGTTATGGRFSLTRMTPEQFSANLVAIASYDRHRFQDAATGRELDYLQLVYGVPLGGVDFETASHRDPVTKAQTVLVARTASFKLALAAVYEDWHRGEGARRIFTSCNMAADRPLGLPDDGQLSPAWRQRILEGEARWRTQVEELFWRFLSRPPTATELAAVQSTFLAALGESGWTGHGWAAVVYALMSSAEYWHL